MSLLDWHKRGDREPALIEWLRRDRWFADIDASARSRFIYSQVEDGRCGTSILGVINGLLPAIGLVLVVCWDETSRYWLALWRRWW